MLFSQQRLVHVSFLFFLFLWLSLCSTEEPNEQRHAYYVALNVRIGSVKHSNEMKNIVSLFVFSFAFCDCVVFSFLCNLPCNAKNKSKKKRTSKLEILQKGAENPPLHQLHRNARLQKVCSSLRSAVTVGYSALLGRTGDKTSSLLYGQLKAKDV